MNVKKLMLKMVAAVATGAALHMAAFADAETSSDVLMWYLNLSDSSDKEVQSISQIDSINIFLQSTGEDRSKRIFLNQYTYVNEDDVGTGQNTGLAGGIHGTSAGTYYTDLSGAGDINYNNYEFMMTVLSGGSVVAWSSTLFKADNGTQVTKALLDDADALYARGGGDLNPSSAGATAYNFGQRMVPEPTSGLLMLVGGALLALRRKREQA